uniref:Small ribosomal subunit protein uS7c n=2 Tax=Bryopsidineae TaxID=2791029 RepID=A0A0D6E1Y4_BRYPL|nr:30S ribosomal protein S7 [Bryopsis plumosa]AJF21957.1 ribosomal protein S7 [Codium decorticatum]CEO91048.1 30S ribosomal protein S7 [Bryopsis plumosa]
MSRRRLSKKRKIIADPIYDSLLIQMFTNRLLKKGKKQLAYRILLESLSLIQTKKKQDAIQTLETAIQNLSPSIEIKTKRIGGAVYSIPVEITSVRATNLAIRWLLMAAKQRSGKSMSVKLSDEIFDAFKNIGNAIRKKEEVHRMAESSSRLMKK